VMFVGLSIGGMIGQTIALDHPDRLQALVLCSSTSSLRHGDPAVWDARINAVKSDGMGVEVDATISRWFVPKFVAEHDEAVEQVRHMIRETPVAGYVGCCEAILPFHLTDRLGEIDLPVLVMPGEQDVALPAELSQTIHDTIRGSSLQIIPNASHFANVEQPEIFNVNLMEFLNGIQ